MRVLLHVRLRSKAHVLGIYFLSFKVRVRVRGRVRVTESKVTCLVYKRSNEGFVNEAIAFVAETRQMRDTLLDLEFNIAR